MNNSVLRLTNHSKEEYKMEFVAKHNRYALAAAKAYAQDRPWAGDFDERVEKIRVFHAELCDAYGIEIDLVVDTDGDEPTNAGGFYVSGQDTIVLRPGFAIMTYLRLFAEALEDNREFPMASASEGTAGYAARWANGMFKKAFPRSWEKLVNRNAPILSRDYC